MSGIPPDPHDPPGDEPRLGDVSGPRRAGTPSGPRRTGVPAGARSRSAEREEPELGSMKLSQGSIDRIEQAAIRQARARRIYAAAFVIALVLLVLAVPIAYGVFLAVRSTMTHPAPPIAAATPPDPDEAADPAADAEAAPEPAAVPEPAAAAEPEPAAAPEPTAAPEPAAAPVPAPAPDAPAAPKPAPKPAGSKGLAAEGWSLASKDPSAAAEKFRAALAADPGSIDATYGLGYCLSNLGQNDAAKPYLCKAVAAGTPDVVREANAILGRNGLSCP